MRILHMGVVSMQESRSSQQQYNRKWAQVCKLSTLDPVIFENPENSFRLFVSIAWVPCATHFEKNLVKPLLESEWCCCQSRDKLWKVYSLWSWAFSPVCRIWWNPPVCKLYMGSFMISIEHTIRSISKFYETVEIAQDVPACWPR
jgi:hypothetical protein